MPVEHSSKGHNALTVRLLMVVLRYGPCLLEQDVTMLVNKSVPVLLLLLHLSSVTLVGPFLAVDAIRIDPLDRQSKQQQHRRRRQQQQQQQQLQEEGTVEQSILEEQPQHRRLLEQRSDRGDINGRPSNLHRSTASTDPVHVDIPSSPDGHLVDPTSLPLWDSSASFPTKMWAGHLPASADGDKYFFYWLFAPDTTSDDTIEDADIPLLIWLNGGPACSSMDGLFLENGPLRLVQQSDDTFRMRPAKHSWHQAPAYTLYIDQPVGTGLSFTTSKRYPTNDLEVNVDFYYFLQEFLALHLDMFVSNANVVHRPLFFSGESHAGHYIPSMMNYILKQNAAIEAGSGNDDKHTIVIPLSGAAIGNGWTDPYYQYAAAETGYAHGFIGRAQLYALNEKEKKCQAELNKGNYDVSICFSLMSDVTTQAQGRDSKYKVSSYDARKSEQKHKDRAFPPGHKVLETYLGGWELEKHEGSMPQTIKEQVLPVIHAEAATAAGQRYEECTDPPYNALAGQDGLGVVPDVVDLLQYTGDTEDEKIRLLFFNGMEDMICNHVGNEKFLEHLPWDHRDHWVEASRYVWIADSEATGMVSGYMKEYKNLSFLKLLNSGHMVPLDIPSHALEMVRNHMYSKSFDSSAQTVSGVQQPADADCPACPSNHCPVCPHCTESSSSSSASSRLSGAVLAGIAAAALVTIGCFCYASKRRRIFGGGSSAMVPQYDLELREAHYTDTPEQSPTNGVT